MSRQSAIFNPASNAPFCLSRSKINDFLTCARCFYLDRRLGINKPSLPAFSLNVAVDCLLKKEFDAYRVQKKPHPLMVQYDIQAIPFNHPDLDLWRNNFKGIRYHDPKSNFVLFGAIDDVWKSEHGELIIVDYKATSTTEEITLDTEYRQTYKRQLEIYQFLFQKNGFPVSKSAYIVYANALKERQAFSINTYRL